MSGHALTPQEQFLIYINRLRDELDTAYTYYEIAKSLREFRHTRRLEFGEALTFFQVTQAANLFATVIAICRFIDERNDSLQLHSFFELVRNNLVLFTTSAYENRLRDKGRDEEDIKHWAQLHVEITGQMVDGDEAKVKSMPVTNLVRWRHKKLAHIDKDKVLKKIDLMTENPVTVKEIDDILTTLDEILNRYTGAYDGVSCKIGLPTAKPQIEYVMDAISFYRQSRKQRK